MKKRKKNQALIDALMVIFITAYALAMLTVAAMHVISKFS